MGRKNSNARRHYNGGSYRSFNELKSAGTRFDLSKGDFILKTQQNTRGKSLAEVSVNIVRHDLDNRRPSSLAVSFREDLGQKLGTWLKVGIVKNEDIERLYFIETNEELGYKLSQTPDRSSSRFYLKVPVGEVETKYTKYKGAHCLKFDRENGAYYIDEKD